jgi:cytochrome P450
MLEYDPFAEEVIANPLPFYARLRNESPVHFLPPYGAWAISRFQDVWDCSSDLRFSAAQGTTPAQVLTQDQPVTPMLNVMDPPEHTRLRSAIRQCFLPRYLRGLEPEARKIFEGLVDEVIERGECDVVQDLGARLSVTLACVAIGLPIEDGAYLNGVVKRFFHHDPDQGGMTPDGIAALGELTAYCVDRIRELRKNPQDGPQALNALVAFENEDGSRFDEETAASHTTMLIIGGSETFPKTLANGILRLWEHPDQRAALVADPSRIPAAYNEILRYDMPTQFLCRTLTEDVELAGQKMKAGQGVMFLYASANRDEREFDDPDRFDVARGAQRMLSFSAGTHACLGTHVARVEGKLTLETILARMPEYEVDLDRAQRLHTEFVQGFSSLPIRFS